MNKTQLPSWGFTKHITFDINELFNIVVNKKGLTDLFTISRFEWNNNNELVYVFKYFVKLHTLLKNSTSSEVKWSRTVGTNSDIAWGSGGILFSNFWYIEQDVKCEHSLQALLALMGPGNCFSANRWYTCKKTPKH